MMLPLSVMKVMPTATQPMNEVVFKSENRLTAVKKPGVTAATTISASSAATADRHQNPPAPGMRQRHTPRVAQSRRQRLIGHDFLTAPHPSDG